MNAPMVDEARSGRTVRWVYAGVWGVLTELLRVPDRAPTLPYHGGSPARSFRPSEGWLRYTKFYFWLFLLPIDVVILVPWLLITIKFPLTGAILAIPAWGIAVIPDIIAYVAIHLKYDTTWYVLTDRSMRIRRGVWVIQEATITFDNIQNVVVQQGPVQRHFKIADLHVQTAGGGSGAPGHGGGGMHLGILEGLSDAPAVRDLIMAKVRASRTAGLGDEHAHEQSERGTPRRGVFGAAHLSLLREIRDGLRAAR